jgi:teichuronic acid exporter
MSIGKKAGKGFISFFYRSMLEKLMGLASMVILARELTPYDFGLVSIAEVLLALIAVFGNTGLSEFLLAYKKDDTKEIFKAAFWFNTVLISAVVILFLIAAPFWAASQHDERIINISIVCSLIFLSSQLQALPKAFLNKNLMFDTLVKIQAPFIVLTSIGKVAAALLGFGVYSLIIPVLMFQPILTIVLFIKTKLYPGWNFHLNRWKEIYGFTKHLIASTALVRLTDQGDKIILSKFLGLSALGIYNIAFQLADMVTSQLVMLSNNILSSVLPKFTDDKDRFYHHYIHFLKTFAFIAFPILAIMLLTAKPLILLLYGPKWIDAALPMQILIIYTAFRTVTSSYGSVMNSFHLTRKSLIVTVVYTPFHLLASFAGALAGPAGVALGISLVKITFINWNIKQVMNAVSKPVIKWYNDLSPYFLTTIILTIAFLVVSIGLNLTYALSPITFITIMTFSFIVAYYTCFRLFLSAELEKISNFVGLTFPKMQRYFNLVFSI